MEENLKPTPGSSPTALIIFFAIILGYGWQVHGFWIGVALALLFLVFVPVLNVIALSRFQSLKLGTYFRIGLFILIMLGIALTGAEICDASSGNCESLI